jgi:HSP20 family molecular chaperone IbpA
VSRLSPFNSPLLLGFDQLERTLDRLTRSSGEGYPPYNIEKTGENSLRIVLAVAGFAIADLSIDVVENQLTIRGRQQEDEERVYLHRGIAARQFQRSFMLAEGMEVTGAHLDNGLLSIDLVRPPVESRVRNVRIDGARQTGARTTIDVGNGDS